MVVYENYDDDLTNYEATRSLLHTLAMNTLVFICLILLFEFVRHLKAIHLKRATTKLLQSKRTPPIPSTYLFSWVFSVIKISDDELLHMVGLDGYMLLRYCN